MRIQTLLGPAEIARLTPGSCAGYTCVVFDILRATTTIVTALYSGASRVVPVSTIEEAIAYKRERNPRVLLGGERNGDPIPSFDLGNSPREYLHVQAREIVITTTNGTVALKACEGADHLLAASFLNMTATANWLKTKMPEKLRILCAGTFDAFALEDALAAGCLLEKLHPKEDCLCDASLALLELFSRSKDRWREWLRSSKNAKALQRAGRSADIDFALLLDSSPIVCLHDGTGLVAEKPPNK